MAIVAPVFVVISNYIFDCTSMAWKHSICPTSVGVVLLYQDVNSSALLVLVS